MKILVVDDDEGVRRSLTLLLENIGHEVETATGPGEAFRSFLEEDFDLVLTDVTMNGKTRAGFYILCEIKETSPETLVILMSGDFPPGLREEAMKRGAIATLNKPFSIEVLQATLSSVQKDLMPE